MVTLADAVQVLFPNSVPLVDWTVRQDSAGARITKWNADLGPQPTDVQLAGVTDQQVADAKKARKDTAAPDLAAVRDAAAQAVSKMRAYKALTSPTPVQTKAYLDLTADVLEQVMKAVLKLASTQV